MGIQINGQNDTISATDGSLTIDGATVNATGLTGTPNVNVGVLTAASAVISGNLQVDGTTTTLDTLLTEVDKLEVGANNTTVGVAITQSGTGDILRLYDGATQVVTVKDGGSVGIGSQTPQATLDVASTTPVVRFTDTDAGQYTELLNSGSSFYISADRGNGGNGDIIFRSGGTTEKVRIDSSGNVGIGTNNPGDSRLFVNNTFNSTYTTNAYNDDFLLIKNSSTIANTASSIYMIASGDGNSAAVGTINLIHSNNGSGDLSFQTRYNGGMFERLRISSGGKVGIGTTNPKQKLSIVGRVNSDDDGDYYGAWFNGNTAAGQYSYFAVGPWYSASMYMQKGTSDTHSHLYEYNSGHDIVLQAGSGNNGLTGASGNVGIGTFAMNAKLEVHSAASKINTVTIKTSAGAGAYAGLAFMAGQTSAGREKAAIYFQETNNGAHYTGDIVFALNNDSGSAVQVGTSDERLRITSSGNVGIGTNNPDYSLTIGDGSSYVIQNLKAATNEFCEFRFGDTDSVAQGKITYDHNDDSLRFTTNTSERLRITSTGAIGIGSDFTAIETAGGGGITLDSGVGGGNIGVFLKATGYTGNQTKLWQDSANAVSYLESTERPLIIKAGDSSGSDYLRIDVAGSERFRISSTGNVLIDSASNGTRYTQYQILTGSKTFGTTSGAWTDVARVGHSHAIEITYMVVQGGGYSFGGAHGTSLMNTRYGSSSNEQVLHKNVGAMNGGEITGHELRYLNSGGTTDYLLQARVYFTGTTNGTFTMGYSIKGHSSDLMYSV